MRLNDPIMYSTLIYMNAVEHDIDLRLFGPIKTFVTGFILDFLDYKFVMTTVRCLSKSFVVHTQDNLNYSPNMNRTAYLKTSLHEVFSGTMRMPIMGHSYYRNCTKLVVIYQQCKGKEPPTLNVEQESMFMSDLFEHNNLFPRMRSLKIIVSHSRL